MAMLVSQFKCFAVLRCNPGVPILSHIQSNFIRASHERCYHVCYKTKHFVSTEFRNSYPLCKRHKVDPASAVVIRYLSHAVGNGGGSSEKSSKLLSNTTPPTEYPPKVDSSSIAGRSGAQETDITTSSELLTEPTKSSELSADFIPEPPSPPVSELLNTVQETVGEPTFASLGLGGWTPVGIVQNCLEYLHIDCGLPWWGAIALGTAMVRIFIFPLVIISQRNAAKMNNCLPQLQVLQLKMTEARQTGNQLEAARYAQEMMVFMKENNLNPLKNMIVPLAQAPFFISFFLSLRKMAACPVESLKEGGLFWFTDLTVPDQYFLLPVLTSITLWVTIEVGTDTAKLSAGNMQLMAYFLRALPVIILPFTVNFPGAILCYWVSSNFISLGQVAFLKIPAVRDYLKIEKLVQHKAETLPIKSKGFTKGLKESWENMKVTNSLEERQRFDEMQFLKAGRGPIQKTYKRDPTKEVLSSSKEGSSNKAKLK